MHVHRGALERRRLLDDVPVPKITAFLFHRGSHSDPNRLAANADKNSRGSSALGMGFTFDDTDTKGIATPLAEMYRLLREDPRNAERIRPYIGGSEFNTSPTQSHSRFIIDFGELPLSRDSSLLPWTSQDPSQRDFCLRKGRVPGDYPGPVAADWPSLLSIVEKKVKPHRAKKDAKRYPRMVHQWWKYWNARPALYASIADLDRVLAVSQVGPQGAFAQLPNGLVYAETLIIFPFPTKAAFCALQARPHDVWARFFGSSMKDDPRYTIARCFETFPFPESWETHPDLEAAGRMYYEYRAGLMVENDEGLTMTYNRFHDPYERSPATQRLRELHAAMDRAVLTAYGWTDIPTDCQFLLDYEIDEETWGTKKKPYRYRWPNEIRDEVLARLLELNSRRAAAEQPLRRGR